MATKEKNEELKLKLDDLTKQIKANSKDARWADKLIKEVLSIKGQMSVDTVDDFINEFKMHYKHDYGATSIMSGETRGVPTYVYATTGYRLVARADSMQASDGAHSLYQWLSAIVGLQSKSDVEESLSKEETDTLEALLYTADSICQMPIFGFYDDEISLSFIKVMGEQIHRIVEPIANPTELNDEEALALENMEQRSQLAELLQEDAKQER